jgi:hypothetical protein
MHPFFCIYPVHNEDKIVLAVMFRVKLFLGTINELFGSTYGPVLSKMSQYGRATALYGWTKRGPCTAAILYTLLVVTANVLIKCFIDARYVGTTRFLGHHDLLILVQYLFPTGIKHKTLRTLRSPVTWGLGHCVWIHPYRSGRSRTWALILTKTCLILNYR